MKFTNREIYTYGEALSQNFSDQGNELKFPIKVGFFFQKNVNNVIEAAQEIEKARMDIASAYGTLNEDGTSYSIPPEKINEVQSELDDLLALEQDISVHQFNLDDFKDIELTMSQLNAIMFMIKEENEEGV